MRRLSAIFLTLITVAIIWLLDHPLGALPALGRLLDPVNGCWTAAEPVHKDFSGMAKIKGLQGPVAVWLEDRLVPHIRAKSDHDLYFAQGYVHAYFRLWQMDMETRAAGGRISEVVGAKAIEFDRGQRRKGMGFGAERSLKAIEADPVSKVMLDAYRDGINAYIGSLKFRDYPLEYKLMGFRPEPWTNIRSALLIKYMADDLTGYTEDIPLTILRDQLGQEQFDFLFPEKIRGSKPVIPEGTKFAAPSLPIPKTPGDSVWAHFPRQKSAAKDHSSLFPLPSSLQEGTGSNNWAISGAHTASGAPILCNDPHLGLNLPSLWFEMQLTAPGINAYGASLPGAPGIVIGFNDSLSWGFTNNYRDVKDYYEISASGRETYLFNGKQVPFQRRVEHIGVKGGGDMDDTVLYTLHGPVQYDPSFPDPAKSGKLLAMTWMAHRPTNELKAFYMLNRARDYNSYVAAIQQYQCPAQNFVYADRAGNIAMWGQGQFINKWKGQGRFVMEGKDSATLWGRDIPMGENPHVLNPPQGYVASANQSVTDSTYPYWYNGYFYEWRAWEINEALQIALNLVQDKNPHPIVPMLQNGIRFMSYADVEYKSLHPAPVDIMQMKSLQNNCFSLLDHSLITPSTDSSMLKERWPLFDIHYGSYLDDESKETTTIQIWWYNLYKDIWQDEFLNEPSLYPTSERTVQLLLTDSTSRYYDDRRTPQVETLRDIVQRAYKETTDSLDKLKATGLEWYKVKNTTVAHLTKLPAFSYDHIKVGGWSNTINAMTGNHGPSWRMVIEMGKDSIRGWGVYPGGESGNPGSPHYADFIDFWAAGKYYPLRFVDAAASANPFPWTWTLEPG